MTSIEQALRDKQKSGSALQLLASLKLSVWLLLIFTGLCLAGVLVPQRPGMLWVPALDFFQQAAQQYRQGLSAGPAQLPASLRLINYFNPYNVFRSVPFLAAILLMLVNISACSIDRLTKLLRSFKAPWLLLDAERQAGFNNLVRVPVGLQAAERVERRLSRLGRLSKKERGAALYFHVERGRYGRFGVYLIHTALLVLAVGGMLGVLYGQRGMVQLYEGAVAESFFDERSQVERPFGFRVICERFEVSYYPDSQDVRGYSSFLRIERPGVAPERALVEVNRPYRSSEGYSLYQNSYGRMNVLQIKDLATGGTYSVAFDQADSEPRRIPGTDMIVVPRSMRDDPLYGPRLDLEIVHGDGMVEQVLLLFKYPKHDARRPNARTLVTPSATNYTGLEVGYDPGVGVVYLSFALFMAGLLLAFGIVHRHYYARLEGETLFIAASANKYQDGLEARLQRLAADLAAQDKA